MSKFVGLKIKTYTQLIDDGIIKNCIIKRKHIFEYYKNVLEANQLENEIKHLEKNKTDIDGIKKIINNS